MSHDQKIYQENPSQAIVKQNVTVSAEDNDTF
jgi:hypothetical protein